MKHLLAYLKEMAGFTVQTTPKWSKLLSTVLSSYVNMGQSAVVTVPGVFKRAQRYGVTKADRLRGALRTMSGVAIRGQGLDQMFVLSSNETMIIFQRQHRVGTKVTTENTGYLIIFDSPKDAKAYMESPEYVS